MFADPTRPIKRLDERRKAVVELFFHPALVLVWGGIVWSASAQFAAQCLMR